MTKVLLVEDNFELAEITAKFLLDNFHIELFRACSGKEGLKIAEVNEDLSLVISDYQMPDGNGSWLFEKLSKIRPDIPFILYTSISTALPNGEFPNTKPIATIDKTDLDSLTQTVEMFAKRITLTN